MTLTHRPFSLVPCFPTSLSLSVPPASPSFSFHPIEATEREAELRWSDLSPLNSAHRPAPQLYIRYDEMEEREKGPDEVEGIFQKMEKPREEGREGRSRRLPVSLSARGLTVTGLSPGRVYSVSLRASHPAGASWSLGPIHTAFTSENRPLQSIELPTLTHRGLGWIIDDFSMLFYEL